MGTILGMRGGGFCAFFIGFERGALGIRKRSCEEGMRRNDLPALRPTLSFMGIGTRCEFVCLFDSGIELGR